MPVFVLALWTYLPSREEADAIAVLCSHCVAVGGVLENAHVQV